MDRRSSASGSRVLMPSFRNSTPTPRAFSSLVYVMVSRMFREKRLTSLVRMRSNFPMRASAIIWLNAARFLVEVPVIPSSA